MTTRTSLRLGGLFSLATVIATVIYWLAFLVLRAELPFWQAHGMGWVLVACTVITIVRGVWIERQLAIERRNKPHTNRLLAALALVLLPTLAAAQGNPNVLSIRWTDQDVPAISTQLRYTTVIKLPNGEMVMPPVYCGDADFWQIREVNDTVTVKPSKEGAATNILIYGASGRIYAFMLKESKTTTPNLVVTILADDPRVVTKFVPVTQLEAARQEVEQAHAAVAAVENTMTEEREAYAKEAPKTLRFPWALPEYLKPFLITAVFHDGEFTYIRTDAAELPAVYELKDNKPALVLPESPEKGLYRVSKVMGNFYLQLGKEKQRVMLRPGN